MRPVESNGLDCLPDTRLVPDEHQEPIPWDVRSRYVGHYRVYLARFGDSLRLPGIDWPRSTSTSSSEILMTKGSDILAWARHIIPRHRIRHVLVETTGSRSCVGLWEIQAEQVLSFHSMSATGIFTPGSRGWTEQ